MGERLRSQHPPTDPPGVLRARAAAKINLALLVGARRDDGFHEVVSVMQAVGLWDDLEVAVAAHGFGLEVDGEGLPPDESNLVLVAARELARRSLDLPGVRFRLRKGIPISAGLGGGSADGAAALLALDRLWQLHLPSVNLRVMATEIGSDVPFCLSGGSQVGTGRGERLGAAPVKGTLWWVVAIDSDGLGTAPVYQHYDELLEAGAVGAVMSGSGPTLLALARDEEHAGQLAGAVRPAFARVEVARGPVPGVTFG